ncbi:MAG TPA: hypothetical protein VFL83_18450 [Anaeromyxobacter sp.]|nr:hypothetical protein [Anaeromyxobacter sp.]
MRSTRVPAGTGPRRSGWWEHAGGLAPIAAAIALWVFVVAGVAAPLNAALSRLDAGRAAVPPGAAAEPPCPVPAGALASAVPDRTGERCR